MAETAIGGFPSPRDLIEEFGIGIERPCSCCSSTKNRRDYQDPGRYAYGHAIIDHHDDRRPPGKIYAIVYDDDTTAFLCSRCDIA